MFRHLPRQRSLPSDAKEAAAKLLKMNVNKKLLQQKLVNETGNVVLLKDLTNIASAERLGRTRNSLDTTVNTLMTRYSGSLVMYVHCITAVQFDKLFMFH